MSNIFHVEEYNQSVIKRLEEFSRPKDSRFYAGIGARNTPEFYQNHMSAAGKYLKEKGFILRSGGAPGADKAFEKHIDKWKHKDIFLPWLGFGKSPSFLAGSTNAAREVVLNLHPNPGALNATSMEFHGRNVHQILGPDLETPVEFVLTYTIKGQIVGGTGMALRVAREHKIPIFNMGNTDLNEIQLGVQKIVMKN